MCGKEQLKIMAKQYTEMELASKVDEISKTLHTDFKNIKEEIYNSVSNADYI